MNEPREPQAASAEGATHPQTSGAWPTIKVEVRPSGDHGNLSGRVRTEDLMARIDELTKTISAVSKKVTDGLPDPANQTSNWGLDSIQVKLGVELEAEAGVVVARVGTKATFEVCLTWTR